jgi:outer membrane protein assembly factor BamB
MPFNPRALVFVGIKRCVIALDDATGAEVWRAELHGGDFVSVLWDGEALLAANNGEVYRIDPATGAVMWHNPLKGLGRGVVSLASARLAQGAVGHDAGAAKKKRDRDAAAAATAGAAT